MASFAREDFVNWGKLGAAITNSKLTSKQRSKAAKKAWRNRKKKASQQSK